MRTLAYKFNQINWQRFHDAGSFLHLYRIRDSNGRHFFFHLLSLALLARERERKREQKSAQKTSARMQECVRQCNVAA